MSCFPCFSSGEKKTPKRAESSRKEQLPMVPPKEIGIQQHLVPPQKSEPNAQQQQPPSENSKQKNPEESKGTRDSDSGAKTFTFRELATATNNFRPECLLGEGGFGRVYRGCLENDKIVAVKQLDRNGLQGNKEFVVEVMILCNLHHENLVNLIGYCADGDQRLLVYEFMPGGSLEDHLLDITPEQKPLDWFTRMKIADGAARGLEYLHEKANPPVIYRDLKSSNILLDKELNPKLSDFGLAKLGPTGDKMPISSRVMGTYGYCAPEYQRSGELTIKSDVYSFGVVLLELITGRRAVDTTRPPEEQNLVTWAQPIFRVPKKFPELADPLLKGDFPESGLNQAVAIAAMCLQEESMVRPLIGDIVVTLSFLTTAPPKTETSAPAPAPAPSSPPPEETDSDENEDEESPEDERERAVAEAIEWGSNSRGSRRPHSDSSRSQSESEDSS